MKHSRPPTPSKSPLAALMLVILVFLAGGIAMHAVTFLVAVGAYGQQAYDQRVGTPMVLASRVERPSPDGRLRCVAETDGTLQIVEAAGKVLRRTRLSTKEYTRVRIEWAEPERIKVVADLRYSVMAKDHTLLWDFKRSAQPVNEFERDEKTGTLKVRFAWDEKTGTYKMR